jgi:hypothetical protein
MAHKNRNMAKTVFFLNPKIWQTTLLIGGINICEIYDGEKITADGRNFKKEP